MGLFFRALEHQPDTHLDNKIARFVLKHDPALSITPNGWCIKNEKMVIVEYCTGAYWIVPSNGNDDTRVPAIGPFETAEIAGITATLMENT